MNVVYIDNGVGILFCIYTDVGFIVKDNGTLREAATAVSNFFAIVAQASFGSSSKVNDGIVM